MILITKNVKGQTVERDKILWKQWSSLMAPSLKRPAKYEKINILKEYKVIFNGCFKNSKIMHDFKVTNIEVVLSLLKNGKAAGADGELPEFVKYLGLKKK